MVLLGLLLVWIVPFRFRPSTTNDGWRPRRRTDARGSATSRVRVSAFVGAPHRDHPAVHRALGGHHRLPPPAAEAAGADIGLFFVADGIAILLSRVPAGWLADRMRPVILMLVGLSMTAVMIVLLAMPTTTPLLVIAGCSAAPVPASS